MARQWDELARIDAAYSISSVAEFEGLGAEPNEAFWSSGARDVDYILAASGMESTDAATVVEIGCGIGRMSRALAGRFARVVALDVSPEMIRHARRLHTGWPSIEFRVGSGVDLSDVASSSADFVLAWFVLQHLPRSAHALRYLEESARALKPGGRAFLHMQTSRNAVDHARRQLERTVFYMLPLGLREWLGRGGALDRRMGAKFRVWRGSFVRGKDVRSTSARVGLDVLRAQPMGDRYTGFLFQRPR